MSGQLIVESILRKRMDAGHDLQSAYEQAIAILEKDERDLAEQKNILEAQLRAQNEPEAYIEWRLEGFFIQLDRFTRLLQLARQMQRDNRTP